MEMDLKSICRLCLKKCVTLTSIFEGLSVNNSISISCLEMIIYLDFFNVAKNDGFPANVCPKCISKLKSSYAFKRQCENSFKVLIQNANNITDVDIKKELTDVLSDIETNDNDSFNNDSSLDDIKIKFDNPAECLTKNSDSNNLDDIKIVFDNPAECPTKNSDSNNFSEKFNDNSHNSNESQKILILDSSDAMNKKSKQKTKVLKNIQDALGKDIYSLQTENGDFQCDQCSHIIKCKRSFIRHLERHLGIKSFFCEICQKFYARKWVHMQTHLRPRLKKFKCEMCDKAFEHKGALNSHFKTHSNEKPHVCKSCGKSFKAKHVLQAHEKSHNSHKEFLCQYCSKAFSQEKYLISHISFKHSGEKKFKCSECDKKFSTKYCLSKHEKRHLGIKNYHCKHCDKSFIAKSGLISHSVMHTKERQYACRVCLVKFKRSDHRNRHEMTAHGANFKTQNLI